MPLHRCQDPNIQPRRGDALFDTRSPTYHAMIIVAENQPTLRGGETLRIAHMRPPLELHAELDVTWQSEQHWLGAFDEIDRDDRDAMADLIQGMELQLQGRASAVEDYSLSCHGITEEGNADGRGTILRGSCASLLEHVYESIDVDLVEERSFPTISFEELSEVLQLNPAQERLFRMQLRPLQQAWPAPVLLPAYQMRAFARRFEALPHCANLSDHPFRELP